MPPGIAQVIRWAGLESNRKSAGGSSVEARCVDRARVGRLVREFGQIERLMWALHACKDAVSAAPASFAANGTEAACGEMTSARLESSSLGKYCCMFGQYEQTRVMARCSMSAFR